MFPIHKLNCLQHFFSVLNPITYHSNQITFTQLGVEVSVFKVNKLLSFVYNSCFLKTNFSALSQFWKRVIVQADTMSNKKKMFRKRKKMVTQNQYGKKSSSGPSYLYLESYWSKTCLLKYQRLFFVNFIKKESLQQGVLDL